MAGEWAMNRAHAHSHKYLLGKNKHHEVEQHRDLLVSQWMPDTPVCWKGMNTSTRHGGQTPFNTCENGV